MKILLISLQKNVDALGIKFIHYQLLKHGHESSLLFLPRVESESDIPLEKIGKFVQELKPGLIGLSLMSLEYPSGQYLTRYLKREYPSIPVIWGGIHPTIAPELCLLDADYICRGEGENSVLDIANAIDRNKEFLDTKNLCYTKNGKMMGNPLYPPIDNLDDIPYYDHIPRQSYILDNSAIVPLDKPVFKRYARYRGNIYSILSSRGCPLSCTYCCNNLLSRLYDSKRIRRRSTANIIEELEKALEDHPEIEYINFLDDCFLAGSTEYLKDFCQTYHHKIGLPFIARCIPTYLNPDKLTALKDAGLAWISIGLQSGSDRTCREIYKRKSFKSDFLKAAKTVHEQKIAAFYDVIIDNPLETEDDQLETLDALVQAPKPYYTQIFSLSFYYGTEIYDMAKQLCPEKMEDYTTKDFEKYQKNTLNDLTRMAAFMNSTFMRKLVDLYKKNKSGAMFRMMFPIAKLFTFTLFEPVAYFRVIRLSQRGSTLRTLKVIPSYLEMGLRMYFHQFSKKSK